MNEQFSRRGAISVIGVLAVAFPATILATSNSAAQTPGVERREDRRDDRVDQREGVPPATTGSATGQK